LQITRYKKQHEDARALVKAFAKLIQLVFILHASAFRGAMILASLLIAIHPVDASIHERYTRCDAK